jgi:hypothetical protein
VTTLETLRRWLLGLFLMIALGLVGELLLTKHTADFWQLVPLIAIALSLLPLAALAVWRHVAALRIFQGVMIGFLASGGIGIFLHYRAKTAFALERDPSLLGIALLKEALEGSSPPILAPGAMIALGLLGLAWTYRHPAITTNGVRP